MPNKLESINLFQIVFQIDRFGSKIKLFQKIYNFEAFEGQMPQNVPKIIRKIFPIYVAYYIEKLKRIDSSRIRFKLIRFLLLSRTNF